MSAARWRKAMNVGIDPVGRVAREAAPRQSSAIDGRRGSPAGETRPTWERIRDAISPHHIVALVGLLVLPFVASPFLTFQVAGQSLALGLVALSL
ncbi:MAG: hypothetical protein K0R58_3007, partial [Ramlibacter sp.]|nr:hypothetical protein [Ramlibacter sp.]